MNERCSPKQKPGEQSTGELPRRLARQRLRKWCLSLICCCIMMEHNFRFAWILKSCFIFADPPTAPIITGYVEGSIIPAGSIQKLLCVSTGGNPLATLTWYKNDKKVRFCFLLSLYFHVFFHCVVVFFWENLHIVVYALCTQINFWVCTYAGWS
jgi:hypothetical protein